MPRLSQTTEPGRRGSFEVFRVAAVREAADGAFALLKSVPRHPSLHLKRLGKLWSARVGEHYRALGTDVPDGILWVWIGTHADYDRITG